MQSELESRLDAVRGELQKELAGLAGLAVEGAAYKYRILKSKVFKDLFGLMGELPAEQKKEFGRAVNLLKIEFEARADDLASSDKDSERLDSLSPNSLNGPNSLDALDVTAPFDINADWPEFLPASQGSQHPISQETEKLTEIFKSMGFEVFESRQIDDGWHMFTSLNFPENHPARDDYDTFVTEEGYVAPAHTSTMQSRILNLRKDDLEQGRPIAAIVPDRCFRNEDVDARHEHTFNQIEGIYVAEKVTVGDLIGTLKTFLSSYFGKEVEARINPFYFPFTEPSFEFALSCPFCDVQGCHICSQTGWIELLGCGMIHPNVLEMAGIDSKKYNGFAFGCGIDRLVMLKNGIEDVRLFKAGKLRFLKQF